MLTRVGTNSSVRSHVKCQAVRDTECFSTDLACMRFLAGVYAFVFDFLVRTSESSAAMLTLIGLLYLFLALGLGDCRRRIRSRRLAARRGSCRRQFDGRWRRLGIIRLHVNCRVHRQTVHRVEFPIANWTRRRVAAVQRHMNGAIRFRKCFTAFEAGERRVLGAFGRLDVPRSDWRVHPRMQSQTFVRREFSATNSADKRSLLIAIGVHFVHLHVQLQCLQIRE